MAVREQLPAQRQARARGLGVQQDRGGAVVRERVVPARPVRQLVHVARGTRAGSPARARGRAQPVEVDVLAALVGAQPDQVALVGHHVVELVLAEEAGERGVRLAALAARLDRDRERRPFRELPAHDGVRDVRRAPVGQEEVETGDLRQVERARLPVRREVGLGRGRRSRRTLWIVTRSPSISAHGSCAYSGDQSRSVRGARESHQTSRAPKTTAKASGCTQQRPHEGEGAERERDEAGRQGTRRRARGRPVDPERRGAPHGRRQPREQEERPAETPRGAPDRQAFSPRRAC